MSTSDTSVPYHPEPGSGNYVVGTKTTYTLDLDDKMIFIDNDNIPIRPPSPDEHWVMIADVMTEPAPVPRVGGHGFVVRDKTGERFPVIFVTPTAQQDAKRFKVGSVVCIYDLAMADLMQGVGFIVKDKSKTSMIPCSIETLRQISARLFEQSRAGEFGQSCAACENRDKLLHCGRCHTRYCSKECQREDWNNGDHREECRPLKYLIKWNRKEWWD